MSDNLEIRNMSIERLQGQITLDNLCAIFYKKENYECGKFLNKKCNTSFDYFYFIKSYLMRINNLIKK